MFLAAICRIPCTARRKMASRYAAQDLEIRETGERLNIAYRDYAPTTQSQKGVFLLVHGFPQSSYQFRHVVPILTRAGYRCLVPDYRGAGASSTAVSDFRKSTMARDLVALLDKLDIVEPIYLVGHDIGGMIAFAMASRWSERVKSVCWGECPLPGTKGYFVDRTQNAVQQFHWIFHCVPDLPEMLVEGKERVYISHFLKKITYNVDAFQPEDVDFYASQYAQPGALRCAFGVYRAFETDAEENIQHTRESGKCEVPTLILSGALSRLRLGAEEMAVEMTAKHQVQTKTIAGSSHYLAEENPDGFAAALLQFAAEQT